MTWFFYSCHLVVIALRLPIKTSQSVYLFSIFNLCRTSILASYLNLECWVGTSPYHTLLYGEVWALPQSVFSNHKERWNIVWSSTVSYLEEKRKLYGFRSSLVNMKRLHENGGPRDFSMSRALLFWMVFSFMFWLHWQVRTGDGPTLFAVWVAAFLPRWKKSDSK